jgi:hypothetical protein
VFEDAPETAKLLVGRYHNELRREPDGWRISKLELEILWGEEKSDADRLSRTDRRPGPRPDPSHARAEPFVLAA